MSKSTARIANRFTALTITTSLTLFLMSSTAMSQSSADFVRVDSNGTALQPAALLAVPADGGGLSGYELSGTTTVDAAGATFANFNTVGSDGSGGGAGLGGVFFVNDGASLTVKDANFIGNVAQGGQGGGGGNAGLSDAGFVVTDKETVGSANFISGFNSTIIGGAGSFLMTGLTYTDGAPAYDVLTGSQVSIKSTGPAQFGSVAAANETGMTFGGGGLNVSEFVESSEYYASVPAFGAFIQYVVPAGRDGSNNVTAINLLGLSLSNRYGLAEGAAVVGSGIPAGITIESIEKNDDGEPIIVVLSDSIPEAALEAAGFNIFTPPPLKTALFTTSGTTLTFAPNALSPVLEVGMTVTSDGFPAGTKILAIDRDAGTVTFSKTPPANLISFDASKPGSVVDSAELFAPTANTGLQIGDLVSGTGIPDNTTVTAVNGDRITLSNTVTGPVGAIVSETMTVTGATVTTRDGIDDIRVDMIVEGTGVPAGTRVVAVDLATKTVTLSNPVAGDPSKLSFVSSTAFGGAMNGRDPVLTGVKGTSGNNGLNAVYNGGEGGSGQNALSGVANAAGTGGSGGDGGDGRDGLSVNPDLIADATSLGLNIAAAIAQGIGAGVPDPYPKPILAVATGIEVAALVVDSVKIAVDIATFQSNVGLGLTGTGGGGGNGGDGGQGSAFFGGGVGGAGGNAGTAAGNVLGDGTSGAGGSGGFGGFGAGGGAAGQPGNGAPLSSVGAGGVAGFGGGDGSSVDSSGNTFGGVGGSGFGGAIFVRSGGSLMLQGSMIFSGNSAAGGSSSDVNGGVSGQGSGADLFVMKGADVTLAPGAGQQIIFEGTIADDSSASIFGARNASGDGAEIKINGEGAVVFSNENTYTGTTRLISGRLIAEDGFGIHQDSRIEFDGPETNATGALQLTGTNVPVLLTAGVFDRWVGTNSDQVMWSGTGGFAALEDGLTVNLGRSIDGNQTLVWGENGFVPNDHSLVLGAIEATGVVTIVNDITVSDLSNDVAFYLIDNASSTNDFSVLQGSVTADVMTVNANAGAATVKVENNLNVNTLNVDGGTVETRGDGLVGDTAAIDIASGAAFVAGTVDTVGVVTNAGTYDVNADQTVASLTNQSGGIVEQGANLTAGVDGVTNDAGATYQLAGNITSEGNVTQNGAMDIDGERRIDVTGAATGLTGAGTITLADAADGMTIDQLGSTTFAGVISGLGAVTKEGAGTLTLTGAQDAVAVDKVTIREGELALGQGGIIQSDTDLVIEGATFSIAQGTQVLNTISGNGLVNLNGSSLTLSSASDFAGDITDAGTLTVSGAFDFAGALTGATFDLNNGSITLAGASTAKFDTVSLMDNSQMTVAGPAQSGQAATLAVGDVLSVSGCSVLTVNGVPVADQAVVSAGSVTVTGACAILEGIGYIQSDSVMFSDGASLNPGQSPGIMVFSGDLILEDSVTTMELGGANPGTGHDYISILGRFVIGEDAVLELDAIQGFVPQTGQLFNLFDSDAEKQEGDFERFINNTDQNYVYSQSTGSLINLGSKTGDAGQQAAGLAETLATSGNSTNGAIAATLNQLIVPGTAANASVGGAFGGNLLPALIDAAPSERDAIFAAFTPEGYGGVYEYAYRSLGFGRSLVDQVDLSTGAKTFADVAIVSHATQSSGSLSQSDYSLSYSGISFAGGLQTERFAFGFEVATVDGTANVGRVTRSTGSGRNLEFGAVALVNTRDTSSLQAYATFNTGTHELNGTRSAIGSVTSFADVESTASVFKVGAQHMWTAGDTNFTLDGAVMHGTIGALTLRETGGELNDRLTLQVPEADIWGGSLSFGAQNQVNENLSVMGKFEVDVTRGLEDYAISASVGNEAASFDTNVPGINSVMASISVGAEYALSPNATLTASASFIGVGREQVDNSAKLELNFEF